MIIRRFCENFCIFRIEFNGICELNFTDTYLLTPWFTVLLEKLIVTEIIKKYPAFFMEPEGSSPCSKRPAT